MILIVKTHVFLLLNQFPACLLQILKSKDWNKSLIITLKCHPSFVNKSVMFTDRIYRIELKTEKVAFCRLIKSLPSI